jgi:hypothetical protein
MITAMGMASFLRKRRYITLLCMVRICALMHRSLGRKLSPPTIDEIPAQWLISHRNELHPWRRAHILAFVPSYYLTLRAEWAVNGKGIPLGYPSAFFGRRVYEGYTLANHWLQPLCQHLALAPTFAPTPDPFT